VRLFALASTLAFVAASCGSTAAAPSPTPIRTGPVIRTAAPTTLCQGAPNQPSTKATITLEKGTTKVTKIPAGTYTFVISDKSAIHDFHLIGPVSKLLTTVGFTGSKTVTLTLKKGSYTYQCDPHSLAMHGTFKVT